MPINSLLEDFLNSYQKNSNFLIMATPGAGKTTRIAPAILKAGLLPPGKKILMLQPRRLAAKAIASRIAEENSWKLGGQEVGYQVRFEKCFEAKTQLLIMTEGILTRKLVEDPSLEDVACVILDEFHERSLHTDLSLALLKELQSAFRPDLKIVVMSATLESEALQLYLPQSQLFRAEGLLHPLKIIYQPKGDKRDYAKRLEDQVVEALDYLLLKNDEARGNILIFLPGVGEIKKLAEKIRSLKALKDFEILELHGSLSLQEQSRVLRKGDKRRIILSTNIAETSLTVPGVNMVIDSGLVKVMRWDPARNFEKIDLSRISIASAKQRAGRAARESSGYVYRLWSQEEELRFKNFEDPEVARVDLSSTLLILAVWGIRNFSEFPWFEKPSLARLQVSLDQLKSLGALTFENQLTELGKDLQKIPLSPRLALSLLEAKAHGKERELSLALAILGEKDPVVHLSRFRSQSAGLRECDLESRVDALVKIREGDVPASWGMDAPMCQRIFRLSDDLLKVTQGLKVNKKTSPARHLYEILWPAFKDRLCRRRAADSSRALMVGGRGVQLSSDSEVHQSEYFLALELLDSQNNKETKVHIASALSLSELKRLAGDQLQEEIRSVVDFKSLKAQQNRLLVFRDLVIEGPFPVTAKEATLESYRQIEVEILKNWTTFSDRFSSLALFELRLRYLEKHCSSLELKPLCEDTKTALIGVALEQAKSNSLDSLDYENVLSSFYSRKEMELLNAHAPKSIVVPSGRSIALEYSSDLETVKCSVKLQELFGLAQSPSILQNKIQILFELLSPAQQPMQRTKDLSSFWKNIYPELRSQMKIKYPRHPWPEDPWTATATHKTKARTPR